ncbi:hypothetical protein B5S31_g1125 [[Candida] boidinii]|nr:hypothetical protein B5S31_g1125 [[Candida] boidinii]
MSSNASLSSSIDVELGRQDDYHKDVKVNGVESFQKDNEKYQNDRRDELVKILSKQEEGEDEQDNEFSITRQVSKLTTLDVPLYMSGVVEDAVTRQLSKRLTRNTLPVTEDDVNDDEEEDEYSQEKDNETHDPPTNTNTSRLERVKSYPKNYNPNLNLSSTKKLLIVIFSSLSGFLSPMSGLAFLPAVPVIATDFHTTGTMINVTNAIYLLFMMTSPCIFSPISDIYGRKITFLTCLVGFIISSVLTGVSVNLAMFFVFRCTTAVFGTAFFSVGAHVIGDVFLPVERGKYIGINVLGAQLGPALGPVLGGILVTYTQWRVIFYVMAGIGVFNLIGVFLIFPETIKETRMNQILRLTGSEKKFIFVPFNPLKILRTLRYENMILAGFISSAMLYSMYNLLTPIRYVVDPRFHLETPIYGALFYLAPGFGFLSGAFLGGKYADYMVKKYIKIKGRRVPEDRLRTSIYTLTVVMPVSVLIYGWCLEYEKGGYAVPIIALFCYGVAQTITFPAVNTYCVDSMPEFDGDAIAANYFARYSLAIASSASCLPQIETIGVGWCCTIGAFITCLGGVACIICVKYGEKWRVERLKKDGLYVEKN